MFKELSVLHKGEERQDHRISLHRLHPNGRFVVNIEK